MKWLKRLMFLLIYTLRLKFVEKLLLLKNKKKIYTKKYLQKSEQKSLNFKSYPLGNKLVGLDQNNLNSLVKSLKCFNVH